MDTKVPVIFVLAIAIGATMWAGSGIADEFVTDPAEDLNSPESLEEQADQSGVSDGDSGGVSGPVNPGDESDNIIGLIISSAGTIIDIFGMVILLPLELRNVGFPYWFAYPMGLGVQILAGIGIIQFVTGRVFR